MFRKFCLRTAGVKEYIKKQTISWQTFYYDREQSALVNFSAQKIAPPYWTPFSSLSIVACPERLLL